nr:CAP domain-containing protein [Bacillus alveayuensis]
MRGRQLKTFMKMAVVLLLFLLFYFIHIEVGDQKEDRKVEDEKVTEEKEVKMEMTSIIGKTSEEIEKMFGNPNRKEPSSYDYEWWVYNENFDQYMQIGIYKNKVVTAYLIGEDVDISPLKIGQPIQELFATVTPDTNVSVEHQGNYYRFELSEEDINTRPLIKLNGVYLQLYVDRFTGRLSSVRILDKETLIKQQPYEMVYRGQLITAKPISRELQRQIDEGQEKQIFDLTNIIRKRHGLNTLAWHKGTAIVAYNHSKDMKDHHYFSHDSPSEGTLVNRLKFENIPFELAGENIAAEYVDGIAAVEGWLNSEGHRKTLLEKDFTHLGVGVYQKYYTQNFVKLWEQAS